MPSYASLVLHVLAHVQLPEPGSLHEPAYVEWCAARLGGIERRELGDDVRLLAALLAPLEERLAVQLLPRLFARDADAARAGSIDLEDFPRQGVSSYDEAVWRHLLGRRSAEVLRVVCEVERLHLARLSPPSPDPALQRYLAELTPAAPSLGALRVVELRPLWRRGRLTSGEIWVGSARSGEGPGRLHVAWQACHEATLREVGEAWPSSAGYDVALEYAALGLLGERAGRAGLAAEHAVWFQTLAGPLPRGIQDLEGRIPPALFARVERLAGR
ncbi:MAG: hypothetical protein R3B89_02480 [Polyangiaceae bacterium]